jgi:hypothetical protein
MAFQRVVDGVRRAWRHRLVRWPVTIVAAYMAYTGATGRSLLWKTGPHIVAQFTTADAGRWALVGVGVGILGLAWGRTAYANLASRAHDPQIALYLPDDPCTRHPVEQGHQVTYCHVAVKSLTGEKVRTCRAHLTRVARMENKEWKVDSRFTRPLRLKWAHFAFDDPQAEVNDVLPDFPNLVDVVYTDEANPATAHIVTLDTGPIGIPKAFGPGIYQLTIRVSPDDSPSAVLTVRLHLVENGVVLLLPDHGEPPSPESLAAIVPRASSFGVPTEAYTGGTIPYPPIEAGFTGAPGRTGLSDAEIDGLEKRYWRQQEDERRKRRQEAKDLLGLAHRRGREFCDEPSFLTDLTVREWRRSILEMVRSAYGEGEEARLYARFPPQGAALDDTERVELVKRHLTPLAEMIERADNLDPRDEFKAEEWEAWFP